MPKLPPTANQSRHTPFTYLSPLAQYLHPYFIIFYTLHWPLSLVSKTIHFEYTINSTLRLDSRCALEIGSQSYAKEAEPCYSRYTRHLETLPLKWILRAYTSDHFHSHSSHCSIMECCRFIIPCLYNAQAGRYLPAKSPISKPSRLLTTIM
jgi:hypothetical protein